MRDPTLWTVTRGSSVGASGNEDASPGPGAQTRATVPAVERPVSKKARLESASTGVATVGESENIPPTPSPQRQVARKAPGVRVAKRK